MALCYSLILLSFSVGYTMGVSLRPKSSQPPIPGGELHSSPSRLWGLAPSTSKPAPDIFPLVPKERRTHSNAPAPSGGPGSGDGSPFISSNPAVTIPTGMTDTDTSNPLPIPGDRSQVVGLGSVVRIHEALLVSVTVFSAVLWFCGSDL